jgi:hypothetical protein
MKSAPTGRIRIRMERSFEDFGEHAKGQFLSDISLASGCPKEEFEMISFRKGCVICEVTFDREAVIRLVELFNKRNEKGEGSRELEEFKRILNEHKISDIIDLDNIRLTIKATKKSEARKLIFVHGWRGDAASFGVLPEFLSSEFKCESLIYKYPTGFWETSPSLEFVGVNLDNWIRNYAPGARLAIISHSMGGIVARKFIVAQSTRDNPIDKDVKQLTFVASPHNGAALSTLVSKIPTFQHIQADEMNPNGGFLFYLNQQWKFWAQKNVPQNSTARCIFGTADDVVSSNNAASIDKDAVPILNAGHKDIIKPAKNSDEIVLTIARFIRESSF